MNLEEAWILLNHLFFLDLKPAEDLLKELGDPIEIFRLSSGQLQKKIGDKIFSRLQKLDLKVFFQKIYDTCDKQSIRILPRYSPEFPIVLKEIYFPPLVLYAKGKHLPLDSRAVSIVGARRCNEYGKKLSFEFSKCLSEHGVTVISGFARGIDTYAHLGGLEGIGCNIAVLGSGLDYIYPKENSRLVDRFVGKGTLLSEFTPGTPPLPAHFPLRNRIISGLSEGVLVIQASQKSGSLITASYALEQNRMIWAIPGTPKDLVFEGCNRLIQNCSAKLVLGPTDVLEDLDISVKEGGKSLPNLDENEGKIIAYLGSEPRSYDWLCEQLSFSREQFSLIILKMEMKKIIKRIPGDFLIRL